MWLNETKLLVYYAQDPMFHLQQRKNKLYTLIMKKEESGSKIIQAGNLCCLKNKKRMVR